MPRGFFRKTEFVVALTIGALCLVIGTVNPIFFTVGNLFDLVRNSIVPGIFALGVLIVIASGGIDVSFTAVAAFSMFVTAKVLVPYHFEGTILLPFAISATIGLVLGLLNAVFISFFKLDTLIVTLGTQSMYRGFMLAFIGAMEITNLPPAMIRFSRFFLVEVTQNRATYGLHFGIVILVVAAILVSLLLRKTMLGRGIYALGGDRTAAERAGFNIRALQFFIYGFVGFLAGVGGIIHSSLVRTARPFDLVGTELNVIAAVVLGGARITGGHGSVVGTLLGVTLVVIINNSLILLGISSFWQQVVLGALILLGTGIPTLQARFRARRASVLVAEEGAG
ncbi:ABC transporter permease [Carboxydochorda subterranea]|uniref:ABC transporter permease n=1 Tax=Carboxydichorda subterranea TaxID=3109565 RepID=A0ABZ1C264_9FIRM|nr:ABC transporter permease [Limnochorda sp. L945t]WRP18989.1 ABC transporter permease [Limnochorda sp. L945t]